MTGPELCSFPAIPHILPHCRPSQSRRLPWVGGAPAQRTRVAVLQHVSFVKQCTWNTWPHGGSHPTIVLQADGTAKFGLGKRKEASRRRTPDPAAAPLLAIHRSGDWGHVPQASRNGQRGLGIQTGWVPAPPADDLAYPRQERRIRSVGCSAFQVLSEQVTVGEIQLRGRILGRLPRPVDDTVKVL
ncbi:hypothetical protein NPIL_267711 [Nephila pilipes]|uniref:Uncharacterized protein n=1 Tax=Nephila pilipes TaxID=299642 RepID=A0A8X6MQ16_NEPPI|nr:hypothetical protein NPIL_267711 [Nephila pilipes]